MAARIDHLFRIVDSDVMRGLACELGRGAAASNSDIENGRSRLDIDIEKKSLTGSQIVQRRVVRNQLGPAIGLKTGFFRPNPLVFWLYLHDGLKCPQALPRKRCRISRYRPDT